MNEILPLAILAGVLLACGLIIAAIAEHRRKDLIAELEEEAERIVSHGECPWNLR